MRDYYLELGSRIRELREEKGYTQEDLARMLGNYSASAISYFESGARHPKAEEISKFADILQVDVTNILPSNVDITPEAVRFRKQNKENKGFDLSQVIKDIGKMEGIKKPKGEL